MTLRSNHLVSQELQVKRTVSKYDDDQYVLVMITFKPYQVDILSKKYFLESWNLGNKILVNILPVTFPCLLKWLYITDARLNVTKQSLLYILYLYLYKNWRICNSNTHNTSVIYFNRKSGWMECKKYLFKRINNPG